MRVVIQRVKSASVSIEGIEKSKIDSGLLILLGIEQEDTVEDSDWMIQKITQMRLFSDDEGKMNLSCEDVNGNYLVVSQFTLYASTKKGNRPSYIKAARPAHAIPIYEEFVRKLAQIVQKEIKTGEFGADMQISLINDGPVTIVMDSKNRE